MTVEAAMVALADFEVAGPGVELWVEAFVAQAHLQIQRVASGYRPPEVDNNRRLLANPVLMAEL